MAKYHARITRDIVREISMGALVVTGLSSGITSEIAPPRVHRMETKAGTVSCFPTKSRRDAYIAAINADHPDAAVVV